MHHIHMKVNYLLKKEITELYITNAIRAFAVSTIAIFIPIFLLKQGYSLLDVAFFLIARHIIGLPFCYTALKFAAKHGVKRSMIISVPSLVMFFAMLYNMEWFRITIGDYITLLVLGLVMAIASAYYYMGFHIEFARFTESAAKQWSIINVLAAGLSIVGPLFGALVIIYSSFNLLFLIVISLLLVALIPLFLSPEVHEPFSFNVKGALAFKNKTKAVPYFAEGIRWIAATSYWPILMYFLFTALDSIGGIYTISNAILFLFTLYIGMKTHDSNKHVILRWGAFIHSLSLVARTLLKTLSLVAIVQGFGAMSWSMINMPFHSIFINNSKKVGIAYLIFFREVYLHIGRVFSIVILSILLVFTEAKIALGLSIVIAAVATFFMAFIKDEPTPDPSPSADD